ncbi:MAG: hypothetical protein R2747_01155 [Pyrinomonadaceae bacterium]
MKLTTILRVFVVLLGGGLFLFAAGIYGQNAIPFDSDRWEIKAAESKMIEHLGRPSLFLKGGQAIVKDSRFTDGVIEFDITFTGERGFMGAIWRVQDEENFEEFYLRPHRGGFFDANQYQPVINGCTAWQLYVGDGFAAPVAYQFNRWIPVRIAVSGANAEVYIDDMETPALFIGELKRETKEGKVGLNVGNFAPAYYSNFRFAPMTNLKLKGRANEKKSLPAGTVENWMVSGLIEERSLEGKHLLTDSDKQKLNWKKLGIETEGFANLARVQGIEKDRKTAFARLSIRSDKEQIKKFKFGFSDRAKVYFNDRLIYGGDNFYMSRDPRFLGTIGLFDELYLPLKKGDNELWIAVSEEFGGWGVMGFFEDPAGVEIK